MRILLDECFDCRLGRDIKDHAVEHLAGVGWGGLKTLRLLALAQERFDVFVTVDKSLPRSPSLRKLNIAVLGIKTRNYRLAHCRELIPRILAALPQAQKGKAILV